MDRTKSKDSHRKGRMRQLARVTSNESSLAIDSRGLQVSIPTLYKLSLFDKYLPCAQPKSHTMLPSNWIHKRLNMIVPIGWESKNSCIFGHGLCLVATKWGSSSAIFSYASYTYFCSVRVATLSKNCTLRLWIPECCDSQVSHCHVMFLYLHLQSPSLLI